MEPASVAVCKLCTKCMIDPRILPCSHSFCLKCLESSKILKNLSKCPVCQIPFKMPKGGVKDLKKNEFIKCLSNLKLDCNVCECCKKNQAINFCVECNGNYCSTCLELHEKFPATRNHQLRPLEDKSNINKYSTCKERSKDKEILCEDCKLVLCDYCSYSKHKNHKIIYLSEFFDSVRIKFEQCLNSKKGMLKDICLNIKSVEDKMYDNELKAANLKVKIEQRGEYLKKTVDLVVAELHKNVDKELRRHQSEASDIMEKLKQLEATLKAEIDVMKDQLSNLNYDNVLQAPTHVMNNDGKIPNYFGHFDISFYFEDDENLTNFKRICGNIGKVPKFQLVKKELIDGVVNSFDLFGGDIFISYFKDNKQHEVVRLIQHSEMEGSSSNLKDIKFVYKLNGINEIMSCIDDMLIINDELFVSGTSTGVNKGCVVKIRMEDEQCKPKLIYEHPKEDKGDMKMSKSLMGNILLTLCNKIVELSDDGNVEKTIDLEFRILHAFPFDLKSYLVCSLNNLCIIDDKGGKIRSTSCSLTSLGLVRDKRGDIYTFDFCTKTLFVLDHYLNIKMSLDMATYLYKMCYDKERDVLMVDADHKMLATFRL